MNTHPGRLLRFPFTSRLALAVLALAMVSGGPVLAQSDRMGELTNRMGELTNRIERLQRELQTLRQTVDRGAQFAATVEVRLGELERLIRGLEQRIESLEIVGRRAKPKLERLAADLEHRLRTLEQSGLPPSPVAGIGTGAARAATIIGGTTAPDAPPRPLGTLRLTKSGQPVAPVGAPQGAGAASAAPVLPEGDPKEQYDYALSLILNAQDFAKAEKAFAAFIERHPEHDLAGNAYFWLGQTHFVRKDFQNAAFAFADGFQRFPRSDKAPENLYKLGTSLGRLGKTREACTAFSRLLETFPKANRTLKTRISRQRKRLKCT